MPPALGDMPAGDFRQAGHQLVDWIANFIERLDDLPVLPGAAPGDLMKNLPGAAPEQGEPMADVLADIDRLIIPAMTHWNHPNFFAYFCSSSSGPGMLGELLSAALNNNGMLWKSCPASTELEQVTLGWLRQLIGLPDDFWGIIYDTGSTSSLHALVAAREFAGLPVREAGLAGQPRLRLYISEHTHSSVEKAAITIGIGRDGVRPIPADNHFAMRPDALAAAIGEDRRNGWHPFCVTATIGTTSTTAIDPISAIAGICEREKLWLHVDAAYAGSAAILPELRQHFAGWERADSVLLNPHKWLFVPIDLSALYTRRPQVLRQAFSLVAEYLRTAEDDVATNFMDYGVPLGRRFRALKLWFVLRYFGRAGLQARLREHIRLAQEIAARVDAHPALERVAEVHFSTVCFRARPPHLHDEAALNAFNQRLLDNINASRQLFLTHTKIDGRFILRLAIGNIHTTAAHVDRAWALIEEALAATLARKP